MRWLLLLVLACDAVPGPRCDHTGRYALASEPVSGDCGPLGELELDASAAVKGRGLCLALDACAADLELVCGHPTIFGTLRLRGPVRWAGDAAQGEMRATVTDSGGLPVCGGDYRVTIHR